MRALRHPIRTKSSHLLVDLVGENTPAAKEEMDRDELFRIRLVPRGYVGLSSPAKDRDFRTRESLWWMSLRSVNCGIVEEAREPSMLGGAIQPLSKEIAVSGLARVPISSTQWKYKELRWKNVETRMRFVSVATWPCFSSGATSASSLATKAPLTRTG